MSRVDAPSYPSSPMTSTAARRMTFLPGRFPGVAAGRFAGRLAGCADFLAVTGSGLRRHRGHRVGEVVRTERRVAVALSDGRAPRKEDGHE